MNLAYLLEAVAVALVENDILFLHFWFITVFKVMFDNILIKMNKNKY